MFFTGCAKHRVKPLAIPKVAPQEKNGIVVQAAIVDQKAWTAAFGWALPYCHGYVPIQIVVKNNTDQGCLLNKTAFTLPIASTRSVSYGITKRSLVCSGTIFAVGGACMIPLDPAFGIGWIAGSFIPLALPQQIYQFELKTIGCGDAFEIEPGGALNRIMFVRKSNYKPTFNLSLINIKTGAIETFVINLTSQTK